MDKKTNNTETDKKYTYEDFLDIIAQLRAPGGCPWDQKQTHESLRDCLLEESQEVLDAIDNKDDENLCEELGDVLLQVVMHAQIAAEEGRFTMDDVVQGVSEKMVRRHPHVFGGIKVDSVEEGLDLWNAIKAQEKAQKK
ncbi:MAG: MazG family protein [Firmicutes bacterium]|nr:MazG family protein [Bacillota bacterium]MBR6800066.1 MazG family protein [Bacillota bacterium]